MFEFDPNSRPKEVGAAISFPSGARLQLIETADSSLTARLGDTETMHSLRGAFQETVYIYGTAYERSVGLLNQSPRDLQGETPLLEVSPNVFSLGLGLGYVEILSSALSLRHNCRLRGASFEAVPELNASFLNWLGLELESGVEASPSGEFPLGHVYDDILARTSKETQIESTAIKSCLRNAIESGTWTINGPLKKELAQAWPSPSNLNKYHCIAFDAFSSKSTPALWTREFLDDFLRLMCAPVCVLSTYACTGHLKRALLAAGFQLQIREGYASKRDSTLAIRCQM